MKTDRIKPLVITLTIMLFIVITASSVLAQGAGNPVGAAPATADLDIQLQILVASNTGGESGKLPAGLEAVAREIRNNMQASDLRLSASFQHRVQNNGHLEVSGVGTAQLASPTSNAQYTPTFYDYSISGIKLIEDAGGRPQLQLAKLRFGMRLPVQLGPVPTGGIQPNISYENTGITTGITIPMGEPCVVGTVNVGRTDETLVLVITARPVPQH